MRAPIRLLDVRGRWAQLTGAGAHLSTAPHPRTQPWARKIHDAYPDLHGVLCTPSTGGRAVAVALSERAAPALAAADVLLTRRVDDPAAWGFVSAAAARVNLDLALP